MQETQGREAETEDVGTASRFFYWSHKKAAHEWTANYYRKKI